MDGSYHKYQNDTFVHIKDLLLKLDATDTSFIGKYNVDDIDNTAKDASRQYLAIAFELYQIVNKLIKEVTPKFKALFCVTLKIDINNVNRSLADIFDIPPYILIYHEMNKQVRTILNRCTILSNIENDDVLCYSEAFFSSKRLSFVVKMREPWKSDTLSTRKIRLSTINHRTKAELYATDHSHFLFSWLTSAMNTKDEKYIDDYHIDEIDHNITGSYLKNITTSFGILTEMQSIINKNTNKFGCFLSIGIEIKVDNSQNRVFCEMDCPPNVYLYNMKNELVADEMHDWLFLSEFGKFLLYYNPSLYSEKNYNLMAFYIKPNVC